MSRDKIHTNKRVPNGTRSFGTLIDKRMFKKYLTKLFFHDFHFHYAYVFSFDHIHVVVVKHE